MHVPVQVNGLVQALAVHDWPAPSVWTQVVPLQYVPDAQLHVPDEQTSPRRLLQAAFDVHAPPLVLDWAVHTVPTELYEIIDQISKEKFSKAKISKKESHEKQNTEKSNPHPHHLSSFRDYCFRHFVILPL